MYDRFQSSPGPWAECNAAVALWLAGAGRRVSILTRPVGRVQRPRSRRRRRLRRCFNPHPARGPSATRRGQYGLADLQPVSILTRPVGRVQRSFAWSFATVLHVVSILTRPVGRVQLLYSFFLLVHREPPQPWQNLSTYCSSQLGDPSTVQVWTRTLNWGVRSQWVRVTPGEDR